MVEPAVLSTSSLDADQVVQVRDLLERASAADGVASLSESGLLALVTGSSPRRHLLAYAGGVLAGYAQVDAEVDTVTDGTAEGPGTVPAAELVVDPRRRRQGVATLLWEGVTAAHPRTRVWAHGDLAPARGFATARGLHAVRRLMKLARPLAPEDATSSETALPEGFTARAFVPGRDDAAWLVVNAAAFADHPEQGRLRQADLDERMAQPWFDPTGFILVEDEQPERAEGAEPGTRVLAGYHWTKVDPGERSRLDPSSPAGEVYVVGVHPAYQGRGLARPLTALGLAHLAGRGLPEVVLYVDGDNERALRTYTRLGFRPMMVDVMYSGAVHPRLSG